MNTPTYGYTILPKGVTNSVGMTKIKMVVTSFYGLAFLGEPVGRAYPPPKNQGKLVQCSSSIEFYWILRFLVYETDIQLNANCTAHNENPPSFPRYPAISRGVIMGIRKRTTRDLDHRGVKSLKIPAVVIG